MRLTKFGRALNSVFLLHLNVSSCRRTCRSTNSSNSSFTRLATIPKLVLMLTNISYELPGRIPFGFVLGKILMDVKVEFCKLKNVWDPESFNVRNINMVDLVTIDIPKPLNNSKYTSSSPGADLKYNHCLYPTPLEDKASHLLSTWSKPHALTDTSAQFL